MRHRFHPRPCSVAREEVAATRRRSQARSRPPGDVPQDDAAVGRPIAAGTCSQERRPRRCSRRIWCSSSRHALCFRGHDGTPVVKIPDLPSDLGPRRWTGVRAAAAAARAVNFSATLLSPIRLAAAETGETYSASRCSRLGARLQPPFGEQTLPMVFARKSGRAASCGERQHRRAQDLPLSWPVIGQELASLRNSSSLQADMPRGQ